MPVFDSRSFDDHEQVVFASDKETGLKTIIAVHSTALGPAAGGTRFWDYGAAHRHAPDDVATTRAEEDAIYDVLRLSRGMSYKNAMAGLRIGGGKSVIMGDPQKIGTPDLMRAFGRALQRVGGLYYCAEDVGTSPSMLAHAAQETDYVCGLEGTEFGTGDPSPHTALGIYIGMKAAAKHLHGSDDLKGKHVAIQGVGHVGQFLVRHLLQAGARITVADINLANIEMVRRQGDVDVVAPDQILATPCDILAPCALGGILNPKTVPDIKARIIAGAANNMLETEGVEDKQLKDRGILYAPDYVINAGGIISVETEVHKEKVTDAEREAKVVAIGQTLAAIFKRSDTEVRPTGLIANEMAQEIIASAKAKKEAMAS